jgi:Tol biopolymer transport system component
MNVRAASGGLIALAIVLLAACSGGDPEPEQKTASEVPAGTIVFRRFLDEQQQQAALFTMSTDGKNERQITKPPDYSIDSFPDWSPDGKQVVFHREFTDKPYEIHVVNADGSDEHQVDQGGSPIGPADQLSEASEPAWSPDGNTLAFSWAYGKLSQLRGEEWIEVAGVATMSVDGSKAKQVTQQERPTQAEDGTVTWSHDGRQIAFTRLNKTDKPLDASAVFVANADGTDAHRVTPWELAGQEPSWSPDGTLISFRSEPTGEDFIGDVYSVKPDGSDLTQLTKAKGKQVLSMSFSPDSRWIVFAMEGVDHLPDLFAMRRDGSDVTPLTRTSKWESTPDWSPAD